MFFIRVPVLEIFKKNWEKMALDNEFCITVGEIIYNENTA